MTTAQTRAKSQNGPPMLGEPETVEFRKTPPTQLQISPPNFCYAAADIESLSPLVFNSFSSRAQQAMREQQEAGQRAKSRKIRKPKSFEDIWRDSVHYDAEAGWCGFPAAAIRNAMISACRTVGFKMTIAKMSIFIEADGYDKCDGQPLIKLNGEPKIFVGPVRIGSGTTDLAARGRIMKWGARVRIKWDADQFSASDVMNLLQRAGEQVGIGAGRPDSKMSNGMGWGTFKVTKGDAD